LSSEAQSAKEDPSPLLLVASTLLCDRAGAVTRAALLTFLRQHRYVVQASVSATGAPQAAVVGVAVATDFTLIFDTLASTRKAVNLRHHSNVAFVIGGWTPGDERSVQYEGVADLPAGAELDDVREQYFAVFPDGRDRLAWQGIMHVRVRPSWLRYSDYTAGPPEVLEFDASALQALR
jgi:hypothetical protein